MRTVIHLDGPNCDLLRYMRKTTKPFQRETRHVRESSSKSY
jgi:hypothetical protein